jgi:hypothetical protein
MVVSSTANNRAVEIHHGRLKARWENILTSKIRISLLKVLHVGSNRHLSRSCTSFLIRKYFATSAIGLTR